MLSSEMLCCTKVLKRLCTVKMQEAFHSSDVNVIEHFQRAMSPGTRHLSDPSTSRFTTVSDYL